MTCHGPRNTKELLAALEAEGAVIERARNGHFRVIHPSGRRCQIAFTPRPRTVLNAVARLRQIGFVLRGNASKGTRQR